jgi:hypothetical protein
VNDSPAFAKLVGGKTIQDMAGIPYPTRVHPDGVHVGLIIETKPTKLILRHRESAAAMGPLSWDVGALNQIHDDYIFIPYNHDDLYMEFDEAGKEVLYFFENGQFSPNGSKEKPTYNPLVQ